MKARHLTILGLLLLVPAATAGLWEADAASLAGAFEGEAESFGNWAVLDGVQRSTVREHFTSLLEIARGLLEGWMSGLAGRGLDEETVAALWGRMKRLKAELDELSSRGAAGVIETRAAEGYYAVTLLEAAGNLRELALLFDDADL
jgi:hypothetical protein